MNIFKLFGVALGLKVGPTRLEAKVQEGFYVTKVQNS